MLNRILDQKANEQGAQEAIVFGSQRYNYSQLQERVSQCAAGLAQCGVGPRDGVALVVKNSPEFIFTLLAAARLGAPALLLDSGSKPAELRRIFSQNLIAAAICERGLLACLEQIRQLTQQNFRIFARGEGFSSLLGPACLSAATRSLENEIALIQYSSGSTGIPKCIPRSHGNLLWEAKNFHETVKTQPDDRILCAIPLFHSHALGNAMLAALYAGATLVLVEEFNRAALLELLDRERITVFPTVPFIVDLLVRYVRGDSAKPTNSLRVAFSAGAPLAPALARGFHEAFGIYMRQLYGSTEVGSASINLDSDIEHLLESVGPPMKNVRIEILREDGRPADENELGEVAIQSPASATGYRNQPELTRERFRNGFFHPGDLGRRKAGGHLYLDGRAAMLISSAGRKVDPREVESVIAAYSKVSEVVVVSAPGFLGEQVVKAVIVPHEACEAREIVDYCRDKLADFKIPRRVEFVSEIPRSPSGKILRKDLIA